MNWIKNLFKSLFKSKPKKQVLSEDLARKRVNQKLQEFKK